jgi:hypothetical protein
MSLPLLECTDRISAPPCCVLDLDVTNEFRAPCRRAQQPSVGSELPPRVTGKFDPVQPSYI